MPFNPPNVYKVNKIISNWKKEEKEECEVIRAAEQDLFSEQGSRTPRYNVTLERCTKGAKVYYWVCVADERGGIESEKFSNLGDAEHFFENMVASYGAYSPLKEVSEEDW